MRLKIRLLIVMTICPVAFLLAQLPYQNPNLSSAARAKASSEKIKGAEVILKSE